MPPIRAGCVYSNTSSATSGDKVMRRIEGAFLNLEFGGSSLICVRGRCTGIVSSPPATMLALNAPDDNSIYHPSYV